MPAKRVTIKDVAREAGVSFKTVSNVLNDTGSMREETRQRVRRAIDRLGYTVNVSAKSLRTGSTGLIGLAIFGFSQPFAPYLADQVIEYARRHDYGVIVDTYGQQGQGLLPVLRQASRLGADGWMVFADRPFEDGGTLLEQSYPLVMAGDYLSYDRVDQVTMPNVEGLRYATGRLLDSGCRRIALFGADGGHHDHGSYMRATEGTQALRVRGYLEAFEERGLHADMDMLYSRPLVADGGAHAVDDMISRGELPDAIVCLNDAMALGALHGLQIHGIRVPKDIQVIGFDNVPESSFSNPALTTIDPDVGDYAAHAVDMLIERIEGHDGPARVYTTGFTMVERGSTRL